MDKDYNFDQSPEEQEAEIAKIADNQSVKYLVVEGSFVAKFPDGKILKVPVKLSVEQLDGIDDASKGQIEQAKALIGMFGTERDQKYLAGQSVFSTVDFIEKYMKVFARVQGLAMGEPSDSSAS